MFIDDLKQRGRSPRYIEDVETAMKQLIAFGITDLKADNLADRVRAFVASVQCCQPRRMGAALAPRTKNKKLIHIKGLITFALNNERLHGERQKCLGTVLPGICDESEAEGFEPPRPLRACWFSKPVH